MAEIYISPSAAEKIVNNPYYHLKHYGELPHLDSNYYLNIMSIAEEEAKNKLKEIIQKQREKENQKLNSIFKHSLFQKSLVSLGYSTTEAKQLVEVFNKGKNGDIEDKIYFLNFLDTFSFNGIQDYSEDPLGEVVRIIGECFNDITPTSKEFSSLENQRIFISSLKSVFDELYNYYSKYKEDTIMSNLLKSPLQKLKYLIDYYGKQYQKKVRDNQHAAIEVNSLLDSLNEYVDIKKGNRWSKLLEANQNYDVVKTVLQDSASGFLIQSGGKNYEESVKNHLLQQIEKVFSGMKINVDSKGGEVVGGKKDNFNTSQKADISLIFSLSGKSSISNSEYGITFSVKKSGQSSSSIQIHHGGSLFAYANRLSSYNPDLSFLNDGKFQYVYVNEFQKKNFGGDFTEGFKSILKSFGFYFLGQQIEGLTGGADFLYVAGKICAFSTILEKALHDPNLFQVTIRFLQKDPLSQKVKMMEEDFPAAKVGQFYSDAFIEKSIDIGRQAIYGTNFTLNLKKSSLNL